MAFASQLLQSNFSALTDDESKDAYFGIKWIGEDYANSLCREEQLILYMYLVGILEFSLCSIFHLYVCTYTPVLQDEHHD